MMIIGQKPRLLPNGPESPILILEDDETTMEGFNPTLAREKIAKQGAPDGWVAIHRIVASRYLPSRRA